MQSQRDGVRKRPRKIWSCLECRRKKLQCDHGLPACGRCTRSGSAANCVYATTTPTTTTASSSNRAPNRTSVADDAKGPGPTSQVQGRTVDAELLSRVESLEDKLWSFQTSPQIASIPRQRLKTDAAGQLPSPEGTNEDEDVIAPAIIDAPLLRGSAFRTKFNGNTCTMTIAEYVPGLKSFKKDALATFPAFEQVQQYLNKTEERKALTPLKPNLTAEENVKFLLPPQLETDRLVRIYLDSFDHIYPVLHEPTFQESYRQIWTSDLAVDTRFLVVVLLIVAIADCLTSAPITSTTSPAAQASRSKATVILDIVEQWLHARVYQYESILDFQIQFLLLLGRQLNGKRNKRTWANAGGVIRTFMVTGMHRDPEELAKETTAEDKMMRRRIWAAAIEFELQAAFEHGMPPAPWSIHSDIGPPLNVNDGDSQTVLPLDKYTKSSFLAVSWKSLCLRHQLCSILNDMNGATNPHNRAVSYTDTLKQLHQACPKWTEPSSAAAKALLTINIHQFILAIHEQQLLNSTSSVEKQLSRMIMVDSATQMLSAHKTAQESGSDLVEVLYNDHVRAALSICHAYTTADPLTDRFLISAIESTVSPAMDMAISMYTEKVMRFGGSKLDLWYICAADGLMKSSADPSQRPTYVQQAVDHFTRPFYRLMALTRDPILGQQGTTDPVGSKTPIPSRPDDTLASERIGISGDDLSLPGFADLAEWTFDDFSFDPNDFFGSAASDVVSGD